MMIIVESPYHPVVAEIRIFDTLTGSSSSTWFNRPPPPGGPCRRDKPPRFSVLVDAVQTWIF